MKTEIKTVLQNSTVARPWNYKTFFILNFTGHAISIAHKNLIAGKKISLALNL